MAPGPERRGRAAPNSGNADPHHDRLGAGLRGGLVVCGTTSDAGKSFVVAGLCRLLTRRGVRVAPFKAQNMALNASVTADGAEIGHAQWVQAVAAGIEPEAAMNPVLLKPTSDRASQIVVMGRPTGVQTAAEYHETKRELLPLVLDALADLRRRFDVVICEGAGSPAEINLLDGDIVNLPLARAAGLPAVVVGDIDRGGVFASLYGTVALLPDDLRACVRGFVINKLRGDPALLGEGCADLERRSGVPTLGVLPMADPADVADIDNEDSLALDRVGPEPAAAAARARRHGDGISGAATPPEPTTTAPDVLDVAAVRWPRVANAGDLDPLRLEPAVRVRWVRSASELGRPDLVVLPGSKNTRGDLAWFRGSGLADAVARSDAAIVAVCAGLQMVGERIDDPDGVEGPPGTDVGLGWLPVVSEFRGDKVLDRPSGCAATFPGAGHPVSGYRIHHGRVTAATAADAAQRVGPSRPPAATLDADTAATWLVTDGGTPLGWSRGRIAGTTLHGLFESEAFRAAVLSWVAERANKRWHPSAVDFAVARFERLDRIADLLETYLDLDSIADLIAEGAR